MTRYRVSVDGRTYDVDVDDPLARPVTAKIADATYTVDIDTAPADADGPSTEARDNASGAVKSAGEAPGGGAENRTPRTMNAPIPGVVSQVTTRSGHTVARGDELLTIEAMKMFNVMRSPWAGSVEAVHVKDGDQVVQGQPLVTVTPR